jgi:hypothetical protein
LLAGNIKGYSIELFIGLFSEFTFWTIVAIVLGIGAWLALNTTFYVFKGLEKIPMHLSPYNHFSKIAPLKKLEGFSIAILLVLFIMIIGLVTFLEILVPINWLGIWTRIAIVILFTAIGIAMKKGEYIGFALIYSSLLFLVSQSSIFPGISLNPEAIVLGIFFSSLIASQLLALDGIIVGLLRKSKISTLEELYSQIDRTQNQIALLNKKIQEQYDSESLSSQQIKDICSLRTENIEYLERLISLSETVEEVPVRFERLKNIGQIFSPLLTSIIFPWVLEKYLLEIVILPLLPK